MPAGNITFNKKEIAYGRLINMKKDFIKESGLTDIKFKPVVEDDDLYQVGPIGEFEKVWTALDLIKGHLLR